MAKTLVIVESPTKKNTIQKYLGADYVVEASVGHVRDLPEGKADLPEDVRAQPWSKYGVNVDDSFQPVYVVPDRKKEQVAKLRALVRDASEILLATDEDREGESISWHLRELLKPRVPVRRLVFHEITPEAIRAALQHPRQIDEDRVRAQEARRIVDRLYGWDVSELVWKKVPGGSSAGRVQSVAVRLVVDRERARRAFVSAGWWDVEASFGTSKGGLVAALVEVGGKRVATGKDFDELTGRLAKADAVQLDEVAARALVARLGDKAGTVLKVDARPYKDSPSAPFTTSTLQQESNRKLRWSADRTMKVAQRLYENGWITYMRTDSVTLSEQALSAARTLIRDKYGADYVPAAPRTYANKSKGAQEAHEAIRPAGSSFRSLDEAHRELGTDEARLYELIWKRTVASQMADARGQLTTVVVGVDDARFSASGKTIAFPGFRQAYVEGSDDPEAELAQQERILPAVQQGEQVRTDALVPRGHTTQPPARLTEASLVKELEQRGIGRPSTYASILTTILDRGYVFKRGNALVPTFTAFALTAMMEQYLSDFVDYDFTARMEDDLDQVAAGQRDWRDALSAFYRGPKGLAQRVKAANDVKDRQSLGSLKVGSYQGQDVYVRVSKNGAYLDAGTTKANVPDDVAPDEVTEAWAIARLAEKAAGPRVVGEHPDGRKVYAMTGRFGPYIQLGEMEGDAKPPRASLLDGMKIDTIDLTTALGLLELPKTLGVLDGEEVIVRNGKFGPFVKKGKESRSLPTGTSPLSVTLEQALTLLAAPPTRRGAAARAAPAPLKELGADPVSGGVVKLMSGKYGPYVTDGETNATLPKGSEPDGVTLEQAAELLATRRAAGPPKGRRGGRFGAKAAGAKAAGAKAAGAKAAKATGTATETAKKPAAAKKAAGAASKSTGAKKTAGASKSTGAKKTAGGSTSKADAAATKPPAQTTVTTIRAGRAPTVDVHEPAPASAPTRKPPVRRTRTRDDE